MRLDITGQTFGYWTVLYLHPERTSGQHTQWVCRCVCGVEKVIAGISLTAGTSKSCGCKRAYLFRMKVLESLVGQSFGYWTVLAPHQKRDNRGNVRWLCICTCGIKKVVTGYKLKNGTSRSCGCKKGYLRSFVDKRMVNGPSTNLTFLFNRYKYGARRRNLTFDIPFSRFTFLIQQDCHYCGLNPSQTLAYRSEDILLYTGLDRKNNNLGYTINNVVPCCETCNRAKLERSYEEYHDWIARSARHMFIENKKQRG